MQSQHETIWRSPEQIVQIGFQRSQVVMMNEAHSDLKRCIRTRQIGQRILPTAHQAGVRRLAMEALQLPLIADRSNSSRSAPDYKTGYLAQPEMREFIQAALNLGWTLISYEADLSLSSTEQKFNLPKSTDNLEQLQSSIRDSINWREEQQALNLIAALRALPAGTPLLVWCGNNHHSKRVSPDWIPMGYQFQQHSQINPFVIEQIRTVKFDSWDDQIETELVMKFSDELTEYGGTAGFLVEDVPPSLAHYHFQDLGNDAYLFSTRNELE